MGDRRRTPWYERVFWSVHARSYDDFGGTDSPEVAVVTDLIEDLSAQRRLDVLDVGAGTGNYAIPLAAAGHRVTAVDVAAGMLAKLREKAEGHGVRVETLQTDVHGGVDAERDAFDLVLCSYVLQVIRQPASLVAGSGVCFARAELSWWSPQTQQFRRSPLFPPTRRGRIASCGGSSVPWRVAPLR